MKNKTKKHRCETCSMKKRAEIKPDSIVSKIWKWHTGFCPGWKSYQQSLQQKF